MSKSMQSIAGIALLLIPFFAHGCKTPNECRSADQPPIAFGEDAQLIMKSAEWAFSLRPISSGVLYADLQQHTFSTEGADVNPHLYISPDGSTAKLVYSSTGRCTTPDIFVKSLYGRVIEQKTTHPATDIQPCFSPDGRFIAFASDRNDNWDIFIISADGPATPWQVTTSCNDDIHPSWSPDGAKLAYMSKGADCHWEIWVYNFGTRSLTNIGPGLFPRWSPTGDRIIFQRARMRGEQWYSIWSIKPDGTHLTEIVSDAEWAAITPSISPDGRHVVFATVRKSPLARDEGRITEADDIWIADITGGGLIQLTVTPDPDWNPVWASDGRIYFVSRRNGYTNIWSMKPAEFDVVEQASVPSSSENP